MYKTVVAIIFKFKDIYMNSLITIAIPAYKSAYLADSINSVIRQTYQNWELIVVDDCSPNDIWSVMCKFNDSRIKYYKNEMNVGGADPVANWNKCLSYAQGDYFCLLCDDDVYEPTFLETMLDLVTKYPQCNVFKSRVQTIDAKGKVLTYFPSSPEWEPVSDYLWHVAYGFRKQTVSEWMYRRSRMVECGGYQPVPMAWGADYLSSMVFGAKGGICATIKPLATFRRSGENISNSYSKHCKEKILGTNVYIEKLKTMVEDYQMDKTFLLPKIEMIFRKEIRATLTVSDFYDFIKIVFNRKFYNISWSLIAQSLIRRIGRSFR